MWFLQPELREVVRATYAHVREQGHPAASDACWPEEAAEVGDQFTKEGKAQGPVTLLLNMCARLRLTVSENFEVRDEHGLAICTLACPCQHLRPCAFQ
eukprot:11305151-Alexandrium_andersonii.AAC.1